MGLTDGQWQIVIGVIALVVTVIGILISRSTAARRSSQKQNAKNGSISIQSGRDTNIKP